MTITFNQVLANTKLPFFQAEIDRTKANAGTSALQKQALIVGHKTSSGTANVDEVYKVTSVNQAKTLFGAGSILHGMAQAYFKKPEITNVSFIALAEPSSGVAASGDVSFSGTSTAAGTIFLTVAGRLVKAAVASGASASTVASAVASAINTDTSLPVTAVVNGGDDTQVDITAKIKGLHGNDVSLVFNYAAEESFPAGITGTVSAMSSGSGAPDFADLWAAIGDTKYDGFAIPYQDSTSLTNIKTELDRRVNATVQKEGVAYLGHTGSLSEASTLGDAHNNFNLVALSVKGSPTPSYEVAAELTKIVITESGKDPALPFQSLTFDWVKTPKLVDRLTAAEQTVLLDDGIATTTVNADGKVQIQRMVTTYNQNSSGETDLSLSDLNTVLTIYAIKVDWIDYISSKYPRHKLADDGERISAGQAVVTPGVIKGEVLSRFKYWSDLKWVENEAQFKETLIVERDATNRSRVNVEMVPNVINQLRQVAVKLGFIL